MTAAAARLLERLREHARLRVPLEVIWADLRHIAPALLGTPAARPQLAALLQELAQQGHLALPRGRTGWDSGRPPLPRWVQRTLPAPDPHDEVDHRTIPWAPELSFLAQLPRLSDLGELLAIQRFLAGDGRQRPLVPLRERSVELFGDEKRLEVLCRGTLFGPERLSLAVLRCFALSPPLVWQGAPDGHGRPVLVVENHHTWHSLQRWNRAAYAAVVYGGGNLLNGSVEYLVEILDRSGGEGLHYFGDLDHQGLQIPAGASLRAHALGLPPLLPAQRWYRLLLETGQPAPHRETARIPEAGLAWLGPPLDAEVRALLSAQQRLAQEWIGWEILQPQPQEDPLRCATT